MNPTFDLVGVGLNATDTLIRVGHFPAYGGKVPIEVKIISPGRQIAGALTAAPAWALWVILSAQRQPGTDTSG